MAERVTVPDMMNAREARAQAQRMLLARYPGAAVVCLCMNIAGPVKRTENIERAFAVFNTLPPILYGLPVTTASII